MAYLKHIFVVVNIKDGYAVIAYSTYAAARTWKAQHPTPENYTINVVGLFEPCLLSVTPSHTV